MASESSLARPNPVPWAADPAKVRDLDDDQVAQYQITLDAIIVSLEGGNADLLRSLQRYEEEERLARMAPPPA